MRAEGALPLEAALDEVGEVGEEGLASHCQEIEGAAQEEGDGGEDSPPHAGWHRMPAPVSFASVDTSHRPHVAPVAASRGTGRSWIGRCTAAANSPSAIDNHHIMS